MNFSVFSVNDKSSLSTLVVVVTHNRRDLLLRCVSSLQTEIGPLDKILVVVNGSDDGTVEALDSVNQSYVLQENLGSSGGWQRGILEAFDGGFDFVWLMDDDGYPELGALKQLKQTLWGSDFVGVSSMIVDEECPSSLVFPMPVLNAKGLPNIFLHFKKTRKVCELKAQTAVNNGLYNFAFLFNGILFDCKKLKRAGRVDQKFFIYGEEVDFFYRCRAIGPIVTDVNAKHFHPAIRDKPLGRDRLFYLLRNTIFVIIKHLDFKLLRIVLFLPYFFVRTVRRNGLLETFKYFCFVGKFSPYRAFYRGLRGSLGVVED